MLSRAKDVGTYENITKMVPLDFFKGLPDIHMNWTKKKVHS